MNTQKQAKFGKTETMDTLCIKIRFPNFKVIIPQLFTPALIIKEYIPVPYDPRNPSAYTKKRYNKHTQSMTAKDKKDGNYKPKLTAYQRFDKNNKQIYELHIEFSAPKLIFGNSVQEISEQYLGAVVKQLKRQLSFMGIEVSEEVLYKAIVIKAHIAKNTPLPKPLNAQDAIAGLYKADMGKGKDINMREYRNGGTALYFYATYYNVIFYDKIRDISTPRNKSVDKEKLRSEKAFIRDNNFEQELLRMEIRLNKQTMLNHFLGEMLGKKIERITLEEIFKRDIWQKALLKTWEEITNIPANQLAFKMSNTPDEIFDEMIKTLKPEDKSKAHTLNKALASFGLYSIIQNKGVRWTRNRIEKNWTIKSWERLSPDIKDTAQSLKHMPDLSAIRDIKSSLDKFETYNWKKDF